MRMNGYRVFAAALVALPLKGLAGCGGADGPAYLAIGVACRSDAECQGLRCVDIGGGTCQPPCEADAGCAAPAACEATTRYGAGGTAGVCVSR